MNEAFNNWWDGDIQPTDNPFRKNSPAYWAWAGWKAGAAAEREACARVVEASPSYDWHRFACEAAAAIRARGTA